MASFASPLRLALIGMLSLSLAQAATDPRIIVCAKPCTLVMKSAVGSIDVKDLQASPTIKTLYKEGDRIDLEAGRKYALMLNESQAGFFNFDLQLVPTQGSTWSFRIKTIATEPYISVVDEGWSQAAGAVLINTDHTQPLIQVQ